MNARLKLRTILLLGGLCLLPLSIASAQDDLADAGLDTTRMNAFLVRQAESLGQAAHARIDTRAKLDAAREDLRREFLFMLGLDPIPAKTPLEVNIVRTVDTKDYTIEIVCFQSLPGFYVTADLYRPKRGRAPFPATIWGPGHGNGIYGTKTGRQAQAALWARNGYICLVIDPIQAAEVYGIHHGLSCYDLKEWYSRGYTPMAIEVWNTIRGVDYLLSRPDVDGKKLTLTGVSGGGHLSWMAGAADPRIAVVQPAAGTADVYTHITHNLQNMHCDCAYFINTFQQDWPTLAGIIAPRPLQIHTSVGDAYYPPAGYRAVLDRMKEIFGWYGIPDKTAMCEVEGPHGYTPVQQAAAVEFSNRMFYGKSKKIEMKPIETVPDSLLAALGGIYGKHPENINARVWETLVPAAKIGTYTTRAAWESRREILIAELRRKVLRNMPMQVKPKVIPGESRGAYLIETEPGIRVAMMSDTPREAQSDGSAVLYVASPGDTFANSLWSFMKPFPLPDKVPAKHMLFPRGTGEAVWNADLLKRYERDALVLGRTVDDMRLADILAAVDKVASDPTFKQGAGLTLVGEGQSAVLAAYAALLDERVTRVILHSPTVTHRDGPYFLNVLRFTDIPEMLACLAPRVELVFLTHQVESFGFTRGIYSLYGAENKIRRCVSPTEAMNLPPVE